MIEVDETTLTGKIIDADLWHSFAQYIEHKDKNLYVLEQSEGSRQTQVTKYDKDNNKNTFKSSKTVPVLTYGGDRTSVWAVSCYASVDGMALSNDNVLSIGTSIDQSKYDQVTSSMAHNIYIGITPMNNLDNPTTLKWLTNYANNGKSFTGLEITKINDNKFMLSWEEFDESQNITDNDTLSTYKLHYIFIDGNGNKLGKEYTANASISDCKPVVKGNKVVYYASNENMVDFYTIDTNTGKFNKVMYRVAGENAMWDLDKDGVLTISGNGKISVDTKGYAKYKLSSTSMWSSYSTSDNAWKPIRNLVKKIVMKEGITSIPDNEFQSFSNLTGVTLPKTMKTIGKSAFAYCSNLRRILLPSNITSIGDDAFWSGYYSTYNNAKISYVTINTTKNSYAESWAKNNNVRYRLLGDVNNDGKIDTKDARQVLLHYVGKTKLDESQTFAADVNGDASVNTKDARQILLYYVGKIKSF